VDLAERRFPVLIATSFIRVLRRPIEFAQCVSIKYTERLAEASIEPSVGSVGDSYDNALAETINGLYKTEVIHRCGPWRSLEAVGFATLDWVDWFNNRRLLEPIGGIPPVEGETRYYAQLEEPALAAWDSTKNASGKPGAVHYNHKRYHESLGNLRPNDVYLGRGERLLADRALIKAQTIRNRRLLHQQHAA
jgi:hypothetical protein